MIRRPLIAMVTWYALVAFMVAELQGEHENEGTTNKPKCETPKRPFYNLSDESDASTILFIYNSTSRMCESELIDPRHHNNTFKSRFECVSQCNPDQGAPFCTDKPIDPCNGTVQYSYDEWKVSYFYNVTSMTCQNYTDCADYVDRSDDVNFYYTEDYCLFDCGGFNVSNVCGSNRTKKVG
uniref:Putative serine proteinase inhibitor n=1 Tax=Amblyomma cajennense TaxID=34607 RepID=A0A023FQJ3_AMBCJ